MEIRITGFESEIEDFVFILNRVEENFLYCPYRVSRLSRLYPADNGLCRLYITFSLSADKPFKTNLSKDKSGK